MTPAERAVINAAIRFVRNGISDHVGELERVIEELRCDDGCICPTDERVYCESTGCRGGDDLPIDQDDPITGELIPAGQNADLERMGREIAEAEQPKVWTAAVIAEVRPGDRIRIAGNSESAAVVEGVSPLLRWHVHPAANPYHPEESRAEWTELKVRFAGRKELVSFTKPDFPIEIETTQMELDAVTALGGWGAREVA